MIRLKELYRLQKISNLRLVAGEGGLERTVTEAVLFEFDPSHMQLADFYKDDLVVTTLAFARGDAGLMTDSLLALMNQGIACLLVKTAYFSQMPQVVLDTANELCVPLFLFDETYIEEVIVEVIDLIRGKRHFSGYERELTEIIRGEASADQIKSSFAHMAPMSNLPYQVAAFCPVGNMAELDNGLYALMCDQPELAARISCLAWKRMILVIMRVQEDEELAGTLLREAQVDGESVCVGISCLRTDEADFGMALCEAVYSARAAHIEGKKEKHAQELGLQAYLLPMSENAFVCGWCRRSLAIIRDYDAQNRTTLEQTARVYVAENMEIAAAAKALFQHPNTVRYRIGKIARLMEMEGSALFEPMLSIMIGLSEIMRSEGRN